MSDNNDIKQLIRHSFDEAVAVLRSFVSEDGNMEAVEQAAVIIASALKEGRKVITCGNGGSLCDATHFAEELTGRFRCDRNPLPALAVNDAAYITCTANDFSYDEIFSRYVEALGKEGDVLLAISTTGNSENVVRAAEKAQAMGLRVISLCSGNGGRLGGCSDVVIAPEKPGYSDRVQEIHIKVIHIMIEAVEKIMGF